MTDLENLTSPRIARSASPEILESRPEEEQINTRRSPVRATTNPGTSTNVETELQAAREQINMLFTRISALGKMWD
jgi:hypothetical protein